MSRIALHITLGLALLPLALSGSSGAQESSPLARAAQGPAGQAETEWQLLAPTGEEFSVKVPAAPDVMTPEAGYVFEEGGERVLERHNYSGYASGFVFVIESYRVSHPQKMFSKINHSYSSLPGMPDAMIDGHMAKEYRRERSAYFNRILCIFSKQHVYVLTLAALDEKNVFPDRFLSSFRLDDQNVTRTSLPANQLAAGQSGAPAEILSTKQVTRRVVVVWKPEPSYSRQARQRGVTGTVVLKALFRADGEVTDLEVQSGLSDGLTEKAIDAARNIRFFPAEKDGRPVSQRLLLEYNFNLY